MKFLAHIPFVEHLGFELLMMEAGRAEVAVELKPEMTNHWDVAHGGLLMTLLDVAMAHAARAPLVAGGTPFAGVVTIEMKTSFMRPGLGRLVAQGQLLTRTATMAFTEGRVIDTRGDMVTHATGTFKYMHGLPVGPDGRRINRIDGTD